MRNRSGRRCVVRIATPSAVAMRSLGDRPAIIERLLLPRGLFPDLDGDARLPENLYRFCQAEYGITVARAAEIVSAAAAEPLEALLLKVMPDAPLPEVDLVAITIDAPGGMARQPVRHWGP